MLRHKQFTNGTGRSGAAVYFTEHLSASDYYRDHQGVLKGKLCERLGLISWRLNADGFRDLENNCHPINGKRLTPRTNGTRQEWGVNKETGKPEIQTVDNHRTGMDMTFVCPKTLSEMWMENQGTEFGDAILKAFVHSKDDAMAFAETLTKAHVRIAGKMEERSSGELLYLSVIHYDARPVGSNVPDPHLHAHNYIFNLTWDDVEQRMKAAELHDLIKFAETVDAYFMSQLDRRLTALGIGTERTPDGRSFEITGVKGKEIFSKRRNEILKEEIQQKDKIEILVKMQMRRAAKIGKVLDYDRVKNNVRDRLGKQLAKHKRPVTMEERLQSLRAQITPEIRESLQREAVTNAPRKDWLSASEAKEQVVYSAFRNFSVRHEMDIVKELLRATGGAMRLDETQQFARSDAFIRLDDDGNLTTMAVMNEEEQMIEMVGVNQGLRIPLGSEWVIRDKILAVDQLRAIKFILTCTDEFMDVSGIAGSGKTTLLKEAELALTSGGISTIFLAPTSASEKKLKEDFPNAITVQKFENVYWAIQGMQMPKGTVIFLDEASMVSVPQMARLVEFVHANRCRLVLLGDTKQHSSPERGDALRILQESKAINGVQLIETYRAKVKHLKQSVLDLKAGGRRREMAFERLNVHGDIIEIEDPHELREKAIQHHLDCVREGHIAILACPIHAEARAVAEIVRQTLKDEGKIEKENHTIRRLQRIDADGPSLRDPRHYQAGRVVIFRTKVDGGFSPGQKWEIIEQKNGRILIEKQGGNFNRGLLSLASKGKWAIYDVEDMQVSIGDQIRITEGFTGWSGDKFKNNDIARVKDINSAAIMFEDGRMSDRNSIHINQGVCITSYAAQCRTVQQITAIAPILSFAEMDAKTFYVLASRATHVFKLFTDCKEALKEAVLRSGDRKAVYDYRKRIGNELEMKREEISIERPK